MSDDTNDIPIAPEYTQSSSSSSSSSSSRSRKLRCEAFSKQKCNTDSSCAWQNNKCVPQTKFDISNNILTDTFDEYYLKSRRLWRIGVTHWLADFNECVDLSNILSNPKVYTSAEKSSASSAIIISGSLFPSSADKGSIDVTNVIIKASFKSTNREDNSLDVERAIYKNIITNLTNNHHTPNVMAYLGSSTCLTPATDFLLPTDIAQNFASEARPILSSGAYDKNHLELLFLERSDGMTLTMWLQMGRSERDILSIMFQVVYTLMCFANVRLRHNDLHFGNIFVEEVPDNKTITMYFNMGGNKYIELNTKFIVKIYDFDRGSCVHPAVPRNLFLDFGGGGMCKNFGVCNIPNNKYDLFTFIYVLHRRYSEALGDTIKENIKAKWLVKVLNWDWYTNIIKTVQRSGHLLRDMKPPTDNELVTPMAALIQLLKAQWDDTPFRSISLSSSDINNIPAEMIFIPPENKYDTPPQMWQPTTSETHQALIYDDIAYRFSEANLAVRLVDTISKVWTIEANTIKGYTDQYKELSNEALTKRKPIQKNKGTLSVEQLYISACYFLQSPLWYELDTSTQNAITTPILRKVISDIWNMFDNKLPISIPRR
jgi:hypothetical protein